MLTSGNGYKSDCHGEKTKTTICVYPRKASLLLTLVKIILIADHVTA